MASLLPRVWQRPPAGHPFRPLEEMTNAWCEEAKARPDVDESLLEEGIRVFAELAATTVDEVVLATDLHAGNVLRAEREPWLVIDPKPFVGDPAYDATQHLVNNLRPDGRAASYVRGFAELLGLDADRVRRWVFARATTEAGQGRREHWTMLARELRAG
jgi:streptomycin 6-kinase